jgi:SAM-dependent methyltransferase
MNRIHNLICSSAWWDRRVEQDLIPWGLSGLKLGEDVLEIGPGLGATTRLLARGEYRLTALELDPSYCERLQRELGSKVSVVQGDASRLPFDSGRFSAIVCFTMLHHIADSELQDRVFAEVSRVLRSGGLFAGTDSIGTGLLFKLIHVGDTLKPIDPDGLPRRLVGAGFAEPQVDRSDGSFRFRARK